ncbi:hypothetical protein [Rhodococcus sp. MALMAid1271]|uniref:hypothetical protein n=1 Tax=Rhodococcus sp. MALMAid1271 TaxID=3411744 RepID=UPI003BA3A9D4
MPIDTKVDGSVASVRAVAGWLRNSFADGLRTSIDTLDTTRNRTDAGWDGPASEAFSVQALTTTACASDLATAAADYAAKVDAFAAALQALHDGMRDVRSNASTAGLTVQDDIILDPSDDELHNLYIVLAGQAAELREYETAAGETLKTDYLSASAKTFFYGGSILVGVAQGLAEVDGWLMGKNSKFHLDEALKWADLARNAPDGSPRALVYRDFDASTMARNLGDDLAKSVAELEAKTKSWGLRGGGALAGLSIAYDIYEGKPVDQAVIAGGLGFGASVAAGALIGTLVPVPFVGTVLGAAGGAAVGIFTSGMVDSLWVNGTDQVGTAALEGWGAVVDTKNAISDLTTGVWDALF